MSAPGIRAYHMAQVLGRQAPNARVTLATPAYSDVQPEPGFRVVRYNRWSLAPLFFRYDVIISLGFPPVSLPAWMGRIFVLDFFSNFAMEWMEVGKTQRNYRRRWAWYETARQYINYQLTAADFVICNNDRQRDAWLGMLQSLGLITGDVYDRDHTLRRLVAVAPHGIRPDEIGSGERGAGSGADGSFRERDYRAGGLHGEGATAVSPLPTRGGPVQPSGAPSDPPYATGGMPHGGRGVSPPARDPNREASPATYESASEVTPTERKSTNEVAGSEDAREDSPGEPGTIFSRAFPQIRPADKVLLWNAGIVGWYDPVTAIRAAHRLWQERGDVRLVFMGSKYPDPGFLEENPTFKAAIDTAEELGATDVSVFFVRGWLPYDEVKAYLLDAYLGLSTYFNNAETHYSHRTRFVDLIWAALPIVCTRGDILAEMVERDELGIVVPEGDVEAVVTALRRLLDDHEFAERCRNHLRALAPTMTWDRTLAALVEFCRDPRPVARPKSARAIALVRRAAGYLLWRAAQKVIW